MRSILVMIAGALMVLSAFAHGPLGWRALGPELAKAGVPADLLGAMAIGWWFGSAMMLASGAVALVAGTRLQRGDRSGAVPALIVATAWVGFGLAALVYRHGSPFFLLFIVTGLLAAVPLLGPARTSAST